MSRPKKYSTMQMRILLQLVTLLFIFSCSYDGSFEERIFSDHKIPKEEKEKYSPPDKNRVRRMISSDVNGTLVKVFVPKDSIFTAESALAIIGSTTSRSYENISVIRAGSLEGKIERVFFKPGQKITIGARLFEVEVEVGAK